MLNWPISSQTQTLTQTKNLLSSRKSRQTGHLNGAFRVERFINQFVGTPRTAVCSTDENIVCECWLLYWRVAENQRTQTDGRPSAPNSPSSSRDFTSTGKRDELPRHETHREVQLVTAGSSRRHASLQSYWWPDVCKPHSCWYALCIWLKGVNSHL